MGAKIVEKYQLNVVVTTSISVEDVVLLHRRQIFLQEIQPSRKKGHMNKSFSLT